MNHRSRKRRYPPLFVGVCIRSQAPFVQKTFTNAWSDKSVWPKWLKGFTTAIVPDGISEHAEARFIMTDEYDSLEIVITLRPLYLTPAERERYITEGQCSVDDLKTHPDSQAVRQRTYTSIRALFAQTKPELTRLENL